MAGINWNAGKLLYENESGDEKYRSVRKRGRMNLHLSSVFFGTGLFQRQEPDFTLWTQCLWTPFLSLACARAQAPPVRYTNLAHFCRCTELVTKRQGRHLPSSDNVTCAWYGRYTLDCGTLLISCTRSTNTTCRILVKPWWKRRNNYQPVSIGTLVLSQQWRNLLCCNFIRFLEHLFTNSNDGFILKK